MRKKAILTALVLTFLAALHADVLTGKVVRVSDGDTITVLDQASEQFKIRLYGIDAPESKQAFGDVSKKHLGTLLKDGEVRVEWKTKDKYGRILGIVFAGRTNVNIKMLQDGMAWHYKRFDSNPAYAAAELDAQRNRRGLWSDPNPIPPEQFRHGVPSPSATPGRDGVPSPSAPTGRVEYHAGRTLPVSARMPAPVNATWPDTGYWLSTNSNKRHNRNCENYRKTRGYPCRKNEGERCGKCGG